MSSNGIKIANNNIPIFLSRPDEPAIFEPSDVVEYLKERAGVKTVDIGQVCICCFEPLLFSNIIEKTGAQKVKDWFFKDREDRRLYNLSVKNKKKLSLMFMGFGASFSATMMEMLVACGVKSFLVIGSAGTLQHEVKIGDFVIAKDASRDEGVSYHYLEPSERVSGDSDILLALKTACKKNSCRYHFGTTWTTDAIFRETVTKVMRYKESGVLTVEMEAAALYAIAKYRAVKCGCLFYVTDSLADLEWKPMFHEATRHSVEKASNIILDTARLLVT